MISVNFRMVTTLTLYIFKPYHSVPYIFKPYHSVPYIF